MPRCNKDISVRLKRAEGGSGEIPVLCRRTKGLGSAPPQIFYQTVASTRYCLLPVLVTHARESNHDFLYQVSFLDMVLQQMEVSFLQAYNCPFEVLYLRVIGFSANGFSI